MHPIRSHFLLLFVAVSSMSILVGCRADRQDTAFAETPPKEDPAWGPGVCDVDEVHRMLEEVVVDVNHHEGPYLTNEDWARAYGILSVLTWEQAADIYGRASTSLRPVMIDRIIDGKRRFTGMTSDQVIDLLGEPEEQGSLDEEWGGAWAMTYTGYGFMSDSTGAFILIFDDRGVFLRIGYPG